MRDYSFETNLILEGFFPVLKINQFVTLLQKMRGLTTAEAYAAAEQQVYESPVLLSENGYIMTKTCSDVVVKEYGSDPKNSHRCGNVTLKPEIENIVCCMDIVAGAYPRVAHLCTSPVATFPVKFIDEVKHICYEVANVPLGSELVLRKRFIEDENIEEEEFRNVTKRIAVVHGPNAYREIPYCGFTRIYRASDSETGYKLVEKRTEDVWKDYV